MPEQYAVRWYEDDRPVLPSELEFRCITDHTGWRDCEVVGQTYYPHCLQGIVTSEPGYIQARGLLGGIDPETSEWSNVQTLPEPAGLIVGVLMLCMLGGRKRVY